jgi:phage terminase small subunit
MAGRPRLTTNVLELRGTFKKDPKRGVLRENEPDPFGEIGDPPDHLPPEVAACWREIVGLAHAGTLCAADRLIVEHGSRLLALLRGEEWQSNPVIFGKYEMFLSKLGMTPSDRSKVQVIKGRVQKDDPLDEFAKAG